MLIAVLSAIAIIGGIGTVIGSQVAQLAPRAPQYAATIEKKVDTARHYVVDKASGLLERVGYDTSLRRRLLRRRPTNRLLVSSPAQKQQLRVR